MSMSQDEREHLKLGLKDDLGHAAFIMARALEALLVFDGKDYWSEVATQVATERKKVRDARRERKT